MSYRNGVPPAPPGTSGAFLSKTAASRTEFLPDLPPHSWRGWLYALSRQRLGAAALLHWLVAGGLLLALLWGAGSLPGGWWVALGLSAAALSLLVLHAAARRRRFLRFQPQALAAPPPPARLPVHNKLPLYVTGELSVEGRFRTFTHLPGFYRTFATREHALICQVRPGRLLPVGAPPDDEAGLWYAFFRPEQITRLTSGVVSDRGREMSALAITFIGPDKRQRPHSVTLHLCFPNPADRQTVLADLLADQTVYQTVATP